MRLGDTVLFTPRVGDSTPTDGGRCAAVVVRVWSARMVNLVVLDVDGGVHAVHSVPVVGVLDLPPPSGYYCEERCAST